MKVRDQTRAEELVNSLSHGLACLAGLIALPFLIVTLAGHSQVPTLIGAIVFGVTMVLLYMTSALYHALPPGKAKRVFEKLDHAAIYLFIAGSYTPFALGVLAGKWGWALFGAVWGLASVGITLKALNLLAHPILSTALYLVMGWLVLFAAAPLVAHIARPGLMWLVAGGLAYTAGVVFYLTDSRIRFGHSIWHLFVVGGSTCHFVAVLLYAN